MTKQEAIDHYGGVRSLADALGISPPAIYQWRDVPAIRQVQLQRITRGALKANADVLKPTKAA